MAAKKDVKATIEEVTAQVGALAEELIKEGTKEAAKRSKDVKKAAQDAAKLTEEKAQEAKKVAKKTAAKAKAKLAEANTQVIVQYKANEVDMAKIQEAVKTAFIEEGHEASEMKTIRIYVKPEDNAAYYVINDSYSGHVNLY